MAGVAPAAGRCGRGAHPPKTGSRAQQAFHDRGRKIAAPVTRVVIAYGSTFGDTAEAAERIAATLAELTGVRPEVRDVAHTGLAELAAFDVLVLGCSTWYVGELQSDWDVRLEELRALDLHGKKVALFGSGDQLGYADTFMDALGILAQAAEERGAEIRGAWPTAGYAFEASLALRGGHFVGLALDATSQDDLTNARVARWVAQLVDELGMATRGRTGSVR